MRRRISVTRRHVVFLFGPSCKDSPRFLTRFRDVLSGLQFNREERDMNAVPAIQGCACGQDHMVVPTDQEYIDGELVEYELVCRTHKRHEPCRRCLSESGFCDLYPTPNPETFTASRTIRRESCWPGWSWVDDDRMLPSADDDRVGEDVE